MHILEPTKVMHDGRFWCCYMMLFHLTAAVALSADQLASCHACVHSSAQKILYVPEDCVGLSLCWARNRRSTWRHAMHVYMLKICQLRSGTHVWLAR